MKRLFAMLILVAILLTGCAVPNKVPDDQTSDTEQTQTAATTEPTRPNRKQSKGGRPNRQRVEDTPESIVHFELNETFQDLLNEVNAKHETVTLYTEDYTEYIVANEEPGFDCDDYACADEVLIPPNKANILTLDQVKADMDIYYKSLRTEYGCYEYFGGDDIFRPAIDTVIADCSALETITCGDLQKSLITHLGFIKDAHFAINGIEVGSYEYTVPFFFRNVDYIKTEKGFETQDGKIISSVDGHEDLEELFKRSLTAEGDLVYYPVLLGPSEFPSGPASCSTPTLTVRYTDGSMDQLTTTLYYSIAKQNSKVVQMENGIPVIAPARFWSDSAGVEFVESSTKYRDNDIILLDLRRNSGGQSSLVELWTLNYAERQVWSHRLSLSTGAGLSPLYKHALSHLDEEFAPMDNVCIMLSGKHAISSAEQMIDMGYNMENTLIVGENTRGCLSAPGYFTIELPNSGTLMTFGKSLYLHPEGHFEEYRGFYPDIWVPAAEAKEAVMNFIAKNTTVTYEQAK